jgi:hypothetical protein
MPDYYPKQIIDMNGFEDRPCPEAFNIPHPFGIHLRLPKQEARLKSNDASIGSSNPKY